MRIIEITMEESLSEQNHNIENSEKNTQLRDNDTEEPKKEMFHTEGTTDFLDAVLMTRQLKGNWRHLPDCIE